MEEDIVEVVLHLMIYIVDDSVIELIEFAKIAEAPLNDEAKSTQEMLLVPIASEGH